MGEGGAQGQVGSRCDGAGLEGRAGEGGGREGRGGRRRSEGQDSV